MTKEKAAAQTLPPFEGRLHVAPLEDRRVRRPDGVLLPDEGETVNVDADRSYWLRRLNDGDIFYAPVAPETGEAE